MRWASAPAAAGAAGRAGRDITLLLDFTPNANHAGIFSAVARHYDRREGVRLDVRTPADSAEALKLLAAGRADLAVLDIHDLALARERGADVVGVAALVQRPLASVIAARAVRSPRTLEGRRVGVTGVPSDDAVLRSTVRGAGGDPSRVRTVTIGFNAVSSLLAGRVAAATAFWNIEGVALARRARGFHPFKVDDYGAPSYPELVVSVTRATLQHRRDQIRRVLRALARGYGFAYRTRPAARWTSRGQSPGSTRNSSRASCARRRRSSSRPIAAGAGSTRRRCAPGPSGRRASGSSSARPT